MNRTASRLRAARPDRRAHPRSEPAEPRLLPSAFTVTNDRGDGPGSLAAEIQAADADPSTGVDLILFDIPGGGLRTIAPSTALPALSRPILIDGYSQPGSRPNTLADGDNAVILIELAGSSQPFSASGLSIFAGACTVRGLAVHGFGVSGEPTAQIVVEGGAGDVIAGDFLGADAGGARDPSQQGGGVFLDDSSGCRVGGTDPADRNVISSGVDLSDVRAEQGAGNTVQGNFLGTDASGSRDTGREDAGISGSRREQRPDRRGRARGRQRHLRRQPVRGRGQTP